MESNISERMYRIRDRHFGTLVALIIFIVLLAVVLQSILDNEKLHRSWKTLTSQYTGSQSDCLLVSQYKKPSSYTELLIG